MPAFVFKQGRGEEDLILPCPNCQPRWTGFFVFSKLTVKNKAKLTKTLLKKL